MLYMTHVSMPEKRSIMKGERSAKRSEKDQKYRRIVSEHLESRYIMGEKNDRIGN